MTTDLAIYKTLKRSRNWATGNTIESNATAITGASYYIGMIVTLTMPGARMERIGKAPNMKPIYRGIAKGNWDDKDATTTIYDYKQRDWTIRVKGTYATTGFAGSHNFYTDARCLIDDGGSVTMVFQDKEIRVFPLDWSFTWEGGMLHCIDYTIDFIEGFERSSA